MAAPFVFRRFEVPLVILLGFLATLVSACQPSPISWKEIDPTPGATSYEGAAEKPLAIRLSTLLSGRNQQLLGKRVEYLPEGVSWKQHRAWRANSDADLRVGQAQQDGQGSGLLEAEFYDGSRELYLIAVKDSTTERLVVLTALAGPR